MIEAGAPRALAAADVLEERRQHLLPVGRVDDLGVELDAVEAALDVLERGDRRLRRARQRGEARRRLVDRVAVRHPARLLRRRAGQQPARARRTVSCERPNSPTSAPSTRPPSVQHQRLHAVTDAEHGDPELEQLRIQPRRARRRTPTPGPPERIRPFGAAPAHLLDADVVRQQLGEHAAARAPGARSAASTGRRSRGRRPRRSATSRSSASSSTGWSAATARPMPLGAELSLRQAPLRRRARPCRSAWSRWSCLPSRLQRRRDHQLGPVELRDVLVAAGRHRRAQRRPSG